MCIIRDTAEKMNVTPEMVFDMWACFVPDVTVEIVNKHYEDWYYQGKVQKSVTDFCLDILTDRIPLIAVPLPRQKAKNKLKGNEPC